MTTISKEDIVARECRYAIHIPARYNERDDAHYVKEILHLKDGSKVPSSRLVKNFKRPFWITSKAYRNHKEKKEWEDIDKLMKTECTQSEMRDKIAIALEMQWSREPYRILAKSPYLYGSDISSTAIIKKMYQDKYDVFTPYSVAGYDIETVVDGKGNDRILMATIAMDKKVYTVVQEYFVKGYSNPISMVQKRIKDLLGEYINTDEYSFEIEIVEDEMGVIRKSIGKAHEWMPDFLAIWNMDFDIPKIIEACERNGVDPAEIFSDPNIDPKYRMYKYIQGTKTKVTASGKHEPIAPAKQWHTLLAPAPFYVIDPMCTYKHLRIQKPELPGGYSLDNVLNKEIGLKKLKFEEADKYIGLAWHEFMQDKYHLEYIVYNIWDVLLMLELDKHTKDLSFSLPSFSNFSDFKDFKSQPKRIMDVFHFYVLDKGKVLATVGDRYDDEDDETLGLDNWIVTLQAHMSLDNGLKVIEEDPGLRTNIRGYVYDSDAVSSYPSNTQACNVSKETTKRELIDIKGIPEHVFRLENINLMAGHVNAISYCETMFGLPNAEDILNMYMSER